MLDALLLALLYGPLVALAVADDRAGVAWLDVVRGADVEDEAPEDHRQDLAERHGAAGLEG